MPRFRYRGRSERGAEVIGTLDAPSQVAAADQLFGNGVTPLEIRESAAAGGDDWLQQFKRRFDLDLPDRDDLLLFCRQNYSLAKAGVPIIRGLTMLAESTRNARLGETIQSIVADLESGRDLAGALARHPKIFSSLFISMIRVGEQSGRLEEAFLNLYNYLQMEQKTVRSIKSAMRYPTFVLAAIVIALGVLMTFVIPVFARVFDQFHLELPLATKILIGSSNFVVAWWPAILVMAGTLFYGTRHFVHTDTGRMWWDRRKLRLWIVGGIIMRGTLARFSRAFAMAFSAGVPILQSLTVVSRAVDNDYIAAKVVGMRNGIERGESLSRVSVQTGIFTPLVLQMLAVGEETGRVDQMLQEVAEFYEQEVEYDVKALSAKIEPIMTVAVGLLVFVLALGIFLPMWKLTQLAGR